MNIDFSNPAQVFVICLSYLFISFLHFLIGTFINDEVGMKAAGLPFLFGFLVLIVGIISLFGMVAQLV